MQVVKPQQIYLYEIESGVIYQRYYCQDHWYRELEIPVLFPTFRSIKDRTNEEKEEYINHVIDTICDLPSLHKKVSLIKIYRNIKDTSNMRLLVVNTHMIISKTT